ncbi:methyltransferase domain-containing protein [Variovorax sp. LjRoot130]|uniref:class I SAM-dependent methyltransferase n=1 Tax=Variovorax sp. LjRoot130 TaxID=3342261 RepID=UPI003ECFCDE2
MNDSFYRAFEDRFRGSRSEILSRLNDYRPLLEAARAQLEPLSALDLGCGRGEWIELLTELGWDAQGADVDDGMLEACRVRHFSVEKVDAVAALRQRPDSSLALISAFHLVEHISFDSVRELVAEAYRVLLPGGILILETPNSENLAVGTSSFYLDPSHKQPIPALLLGFVVEYAGFPRHALFRLQEPMHLRSPDAHVDLLAVLTGVSPDYAVVAQKEGPEEILRGFDSALQLVRGLTLPELALRHDAAVRSSLDGLSMRTNSSEQRIAVLESNISSQRAAFQQTITELRGSAQQVTALSERSARIEDGATALHGRLQNLESRWAVLLANSESLADRLTTLETSRSWRYTASMRAVRAWLGSSAIGRFLKRLRRPG